MQSHTDIDTNGLNIRRAKTDLGTTTLRRRIIHNQPSSGELPRQASDNQRYKQMYDAHSIHKVLRKLCQV